MSPREYASEHKGEYPYRGRFSPYAYHGEEIAGPAAPSVFDATKRGKFCPQQPVSYVPKEEQSEDCLTLSIWVPDVPGRDHPAVSAPGAPPLRRHKKKLPMLLWIHGGSFHSDWPRPRISSLVPGNQALLDQQLAVEFLRKNADAFHGDGERITVFGQSSGGVQAAFHLVSQLNEALFASFPMANVALYHQKNPIENALQLAEQSVESDLLRCLQKVDIEKIVKEQDWVGTWTTWTPVIDDYMFKAPPASEDDNERQYFDISPMRNVQLLVGCNSGEAMPNMEIQTQHDFDAAVQRKLAQTGWCRERHNEKPSCQLSEAELQLVRKQYLKTEYFENRKFYASDNKPFSPWAVAAQAVFNDIDPVRRMRSLAALHYHVNKDGVAATKENLAMSEQKMKLWFEDEVAAGETTSFEPTSFGDNNGSGPDWYHWLAPHGAELDFLWGTALARGTREEQALSRAFMRYVANFAYTGDVNKGPHSHQLMLDHDDVKNCWRK
eukprot:g19320.t1